MSQIFYCPNCGAQVAREVRFCGYCGINLKSAIPQTPTQTSRQSYDYRYPDQQPGQLQQSTKSQQPVKPSMTCLNPIQSSPQYARCKQDAVKQKNKASEIDSVTPMRTEISKLLADFFNK